MHSCNDGSEVPSINDQCVANGWLRSNSWRRLTPPKIHSQNRCYKVNFTYSCFLCCFLCWHTPCHTFCGRGPDPLARATSHTAVLVTGGARSVPPMAIIWATGSSYLLAFTTLWKGKSHLIQDIRVSMWCFDHIMRVSSDWNAMFWSHYESIKWLKCNVLITLWEYLVIEMRSSLANTAGVRQVVTLLARLPTVRIDRTAFIVFPGSILVPFVNENWR